MSIYKVSDITVDATIQKSMDYSARHPGNHMIINVIGRKYNTSFLKRLNELADITKIDALGGTAAPDGARRYSVDKTFEDVIKYAKTGIMTGIKTYHITMGEVMEYESWDGGYIEGFTRMDGNKEHAEYFIWTYIKMEHLRTILEEFKDVLEYHYF